jgi:rod shape-determining protein MreD
LRWPVFAIVLYVLVVLQTGLMPFVRISSVEPDLLALFAVHLLLAAPPVDALIAVWIIGFVADLNGMAFGSWGNVGVHALIYGLTGLLVARIRDPMTREHRVTYFAIVFGFTGLVHLLAGLHMLMVTHQMSRWTEALASALGAAVYTALLSPYAQWLLLRARGLLGITPSRTLRAR